MSLIWIDCVRRMKSDSHSHPHQKSSKTTIVSQKVLRTPERSYTKIDHSSEAKKLNRKVSFSHKIVQASYEVNKLYFFNKKDNYQAYTKMLLKD